MRKKKQTNARPKTYKGIKFKSHLECYMYKLLDSAGIQFDYEKQKFQVDPPFNSPNVSYERFLNGKGDFKDRGNKSYKAGTYTPDFTNKGKLKWVIEVKGRSFADFPRRWKMFKKHLVDTNQTDVVIFCPRKEEDCRKTLEIIKKL